VNVSNDKTLEISEKLSKKHKNIRIIKQPKFVGYGTQLKVGWENAKNDLIFYMDSDRQFNINELKFFMNYIPKYDIVIGYRKKRQDPFMRILYSKLYNLALRFILNLKFKDIDCAFKLCKKQVIDKIKPFTQDRGADAEFLVKSKKRGFKIKQLPVTHFPRKQGVSEAESGGKFFVKIKFSIIKALIKETLELRRS
jgi:glycosyltransferase involved in cell wall biosynthesis